MFRIVIPVTAAKVAIVRPPQVALPVHHSFFWPPSRKATIHCCQIPNRSEKAPANVSTHDRGASHDRVPQESILRSRWQGTQIFGRMPGNLRTRKCCGNRSGAGAGYRAAILPVSQRARNGSCGLGICENKFPNEDAGLHNFGGPRGNKHGNGSGGCHGESPACSTAAGGRVCAEKRGASVAAIGILSDAGYFCERLFQAGLALLGPNRASGTVADFSS